MDGTDNTLGIAMVRRPKFNTSLSTATPIVGLPMIGPITGLIPAGEAIGAAQAKPKKNVAVEKIVE